MCQVSSVITTQKLEKEGIWNLVDDLIARVHPILGTIRKRFFSSTSTPLFPLHPSLPFHFTFPLQKKKEKINVPHVGTTGTQ